MWRASPALHESYSYDWAQSQTLFIRSVIQPLLISLIWVCSEALMCLPCTPRIRSRLCGSAAAPSSTVPWILYWKGSQCSLNNTGSKGSPYLSCNSLARLGTLVVLISIEEENQYVALQDSFINPCIGLKYVHHHIFCSPHSIQIPKELTCRFLCLYSTTGWLLLWRL